MTLEPRGESPSSSTAMPSWVYATIIMVLSLALVDALSAWHTSNTEPKAGMATSAAPINPPACCRTLD
jgi:hypothetical protein